MSLSLAERVRSGDVRAMARAISLIEDEAEAAAGLVRDIFPHTGRTYLVGVTGPPGAGKSTLVDRLTAETRKAGETVGVIAVDPTSPFTGGAILGDRVRMQAHASDEDVFIRSMATRGHMGGLARATSDAALVLDAAGKSLVIIETVGVGQDEVDIVRTADISIVVLVPGTGDDVQALKAGIMEIADIFVVNKCDRDGADRMVTSIESNLALQHFGDGEWRPPIVKTEATTGKGIPELWQTIAAFRAHSEGNRAKRLKARNEFRLRDLLTHRFMEHVEHTLLEAGDFESLVARIARREVDPYTAASDILPGPQADSPRQPGAKNDESRPRSRRDRRRAICKHRWRSSRTCSGCTLKAAKTIASQRVRATFINTGTSTLEMLEATTADSPIAKYLEKRGPGMHHVALRVDDIEAALAHLRARGVRLIDERPRPGAEGALVAFIHPSASHGVLVELKQPAPKVEMFKTVGRHALGDYELITLSDGFIGLDGGAMFGVVPKTLWEKRLPPDDSNRIPLGMRPLVVRTGERHDDHRRRLRRQDGSEAGADLQARSPLSPRSFAGRSRPVGRRHRHRGRQSPALRSRRRLHRPR